MKRPARKTAKRDPLRVTKSDIQTMRWAAKKAKEQVLEHERKAKLAAIDHHSEECAMQTMCALVLVEHAKMIAERISEIRNAERAERAERAAKREGGAS